MKSLALKTTPKQEMRPVGVGLIALRLCLKVLFTSALSIVFVLIAQPLTIQGQDITITIEFENEDKIAPELDVLLDLSTKLAKIMGNFNTALGVATKALELLDVLSSEEDRTQARFEAVHAHLNTLGIAFSDQMVITDRGDRLASMRNATNIVRRFAKPTGQIDESRLSPSEIVELGNAKFRSGEVAQQASEDSPFMHFFDESITDGNWKQYIAHRPGRIPELVTPSNLVFDWRLGISHFVYLVAARLAIMGVTDPDFKSTGEHAEELRQYRARLGTLYELMVGEKMGGEQIAGGIKCAADAVNLLVGSRPGSLDRTLVRDVAGPLVEPVTVVCADVYTGLATSTTFNEDICLAVSPIPARQRQCVQDRIDQVTLELKRVTMTKMPLFHMRTMIDALSVNINATPDLTSGGSPKIRTRGIPAVPVFNNVPLCLGQLLVNPNDFGPDDDPERFREAIEQHHGGAGVFVCENDSTQLWEYDRETGNIRSIWGNCLTPIHDRYGANVRVLPCKGTPGERWTYDPESGVLENAFHTVLTVAADILQFNGALMGTDVRGARGLQAWESANVIGDIDGDGDVDRDDLEILLKDRGKSISQSACGARCDLNGDGQISNLDAHELIQLCSRPQCATQ